MVCVEKKFRQLFKTVFWGYFAFARFRLNRNGPVAGQSDIFTDDPGSIPGIGVAISLRESMRNTNLNTPPCSQMQKQKIVSISQELLRSADEFFKNFCKIK